MVAMRLLGVSRILPRATWSKTTRVWVLRTAAGVLIGGFAVALALALVGLSDGRPPTLQLGLVVSLAIAAVIVWRSLGSAVEPV